MLFLRIFKGIFQRRMDLIMTQNIISFSPPLEIKCYKHIYQSHNAVSMTVLVMIIIVRDVNKNDLSYSVCLH